MSNERHTGGSGLSERGPENSSYGVGTACRTKRSKDHDPLSIAGCKNIQIKDGPLNSEKGMI